MKTYAPKGLHGAMLRDLLAELACTPAQAAKFLRVTERSVFRWLADDSAPFAVLAAIWHETPEGRHVTACDVGNELAIHAGLARSNAQALTKETARLAYVVRLGDFGCANDPLFSGPFVPEFESNPKVRGALLGADARFFWHGEAVSGGWQ